MAVFTTSCMTFMILHNMLLGRGLYKTLPCLVLLLECELNLISLLQTFVVSINDCATAKTALL